MSKLNISVLLSTYSDAKPSNAPDLSNFKWNRFANGIDAQNVTSQAVTLAPNETRTIFTGSNVKKFMYLETNQPVTVKTNSTIIENIKPIVTSTGILPGISLKTSDITSLEVTNPSTTVSATIYLATVE